MRHTLLALSTLLVGVAWVAADDPKVDPKVAARKARQEARLKAQQEAEAREKAEAEAKAKAEAAERAKAEAARKAHTASASKADAHPLTRLIDSEINKKLTSEK